jgi:hypothetical protein
MSNNLENRLSKFEYIMMSAKPQQVFLRIFADQCGKDGESILQETKERVIERHLTRHPEDTGKKFDFVCISFVHGKWNESGQLVCDKPDCAHFNTIIC